MAFITKVTTVFQLFALPNHKLRLLSSGVLSETSSLPTFLIAYFKPVIRVSRIWRPHHDILY